MKKSAVAIGTFDGVHLGHQYLINKLIGISKKNGMKSVVVTLSKPVRPVPGMLTTFEEKLRLLSEFALDDVVVLENNSELINQSALSFFEDFLCKSLNVAHIVVGENFAFGRDRQGTAHWLKEQCKIRNIKVDLVKPYCLGNSPVSSSRIRKLILENNPGYANRLLGRYYQFEGFPIKGRGLATRMGFPTINLKVSREKLLSLGVYAAFAENRGSLFRAVLNIGKRPTFFDDGSVLPEIHVIDPFTGWPKARTTVYLCKFLRAERKFKDISVLIKQIRKDVAGAKAYFMADSV